MKHEIKHFAIKNVVLLSSTNAQKPCNKSEDAKLYKLWVAAKKDILREVLEDAFRSDEINNQDVFEFCNVNPASAKVQRNLRLCRYDNPEDYVTFEIESWNKPFTCDMVSKFDDLLLQEFTITCNLDMKQVAVRDEEGHFEYNSKGKHITTDGGRFNASSTFAISDLDLEDETYDE